MHSEHFKNKIEFWLILLVGAATMLFLTFVVFQMAINESIAATLPPATIEVEQQAEKVRELQVTADTIPKIVYMKDSRTKLCFAYLGQGAGQCGWALATVPCERVPTHMLNIYVSRPK